VESLVAHFLNVGHGDCTFIELPSRRLMMIDINNSKSLPETDKEALAARKGISTLEFAGAGLRMGRRSWQQYYESLLVDPYVYYRDHFSGEPVFRYLQTHPDMDHMSGLHRFFWLEKVPLVNFWDVPHSKELDEDSFGHGPYNYQDWLTYLQLRKGRGPKGGDGTPASHIVIKNTRLDSGQFWTDDGIQVFSPTPELIAGCDYSEEFNDCSYVIKLSYGGRSIILPGDAEGPAWKSMLDDLGPGPLACDILKAAHHGRDSGFYQPAVEAMNPKIVICSVGEKPDTDATDDYNHIADKVLSTRYNGTIQVKIWADGEVWVDDHDGDRLAALPPLKG
jgi:competence protein ComEC